MSEPWRWTAGPRTASRARACSCTACTTASEATYCTKGRRTPALACVNPVHPKIYVVYPALRVGQTHMRWRGTGTANVQPRVTSCTGWGAQGAGHAGTGATPEMSSSLLTENMRQPMGELHRFCPRPARPRAGCIGLGSAAETFGHMLPCTHGLGLQADGDARSQCDQSHLHCLRQGSNGLLTRSPPTLRLCLNARSTQRQAGLSKGESHISWPCVC